MDMGSVLATGPPLSDHAAGAGTPTYWQSASAKRDSSRPENAICRYHRGRQTASVPLQTLICLTQWPSWLVSANHLPGSNGDQSTVGACSYNCGEPQLGGGLFPATSYTGKWEECTMSSTTGSTPDGLCPHLWFAPRPPRQSDAK